jgi:predicted amidophosphoribosyltransferase
MLLGSLDCYICGNFPTSRDAEANILLCGACHRELENLKVKKRDDLGFFKTLGLYYYEGAIKKLIRRAKIHNEYLARKILLSLFIEKETRNWGSWADLIIPAPSSIWGRSRGKIDLPAILSNRLAKICQKKMIYPPWLLYGRFTKKALRHNLDQKIQDNIFSRWGGKIWEATWKNQQKIWTKSICQNHTNLIKILLIDDVVTTGSTLQETSAHIEGVLKHIRDIKICKISLAQSPDY